MKHVHKVFDLTLLRNVRSIYTSSRNTKYEGPGHPTFPTVTIVNKQNFSRLLINHCLTTGFLLNNGFKIVGPAIFFPRSVLSWNIESSAHINEASFTLFDVLEPKIDLLFVGMDDQYDYKIIKNIMNILQKKKIKSEVLPTAQACIAFNFANADERYVAACLVPPKKIRPKLHIDTKECITL